MTLKSNRNFRTILNETVTSLQTSDIGPKFWSNFDIYATSLQRWDWWKIKVDIWRCCNVIVTSKIDRRYLPIFEKTAMSLRRGQKLCKISINVTVTSTICLSFRKNFGDTSMSLQRERLVENRNQIPTYMWRFCDVKYWWEITVNTWHWSDVQSWPKISTTSRRDCNLSRQTYLRRSYDFWIWSQYFPSNVTEKDNLETT